MRTFVIGALLFALCGCTLRHGDLTLMSTKNVDFARFDEYERGPRVTGEDLAHIILFIPTKAQVNIEEAFDDAVHQVPGAVAMTDVVIKQRAFWFLYGQAAWIVEGTPLIDPRLRAMTTGP